MKKIPTLFQRDESRRYVTEQVTPGCEWVLAGEGIATRKYDGTCVKLDEDGEWWARREVKPGKTAPPNFVAEEHDDQTGKTFGWEPIAQSGWAKFHAEALEDWGRWTVGTYELIGPKIQGNPENTERHELIAHRDADTFGTSGIPRSPDDLRALVLAVGRQGWEGIVWHHPYRDEQGDTA